MPARRSQWIQSTIAAPYHRAVRSTLISRTIADLDVYTAPQTTHSVVRYLHIHTHAIVYPQTVVNYTRAYYIAT